MSELRLAEPTPSEASRAAMDAGPTVVTGRCIGATHATSVSSARGLSQPRGARRPLDDTRSIRAVAAIAT